MKYDSFSNCPSCQKDFIFEENENLDDDINDEKSWIQFNFNPENDIELMNGKRGIKAQAISAICSAVIYYLFCRKLNMCCIIRLSLDGWFGYLAMQDLYYALYFTESNEIVTCVSTDGNGPWYIERQVHKSQIQKAELKYHYGGEHGRSSYSLRLIGNNWIENINAVGLKEDLFEECIGIKIE